MQHAKTKCRSTGFTMLEVMIAITILALVMTSIYATWMAIMRSNSKADEVSARTQQERIALRAISDALAGAVMDENNLDLYHFYSNDEALLSGSENGYPEISFAAYLPPDYFGSQRFSDEPLRRVTFRVEDAPGVLAQAMQQRRLVLEQQPLLMLEFETNHVHRTVLVDNLDLFAFDFLDGDVWTPAWEDSGGTPITNQVPKMIRVHLGLRRLDSEGEPLDLDWETDRRVRTVGFVGIPIINKDMRSVEPPASTIAANPSNPSNNNSNNRREELIAKFDKNGDGKLDQSERRALGEYLRRNKPQNGSNPGIPRSPPGQRGSNPGIPRPPTGGQ